MLTAETDRHPSLPFQPYHPEHGLAAEVLTGDAAHPRPARIWSVDAGLLRITMESRLAVGEPVVVRFDNCSVTGEVTYCRRRGRDSVRR